MTPERLPLFPLSVVLLPHAPLSLYIFEERYKEMMRHCLDTDEPFGVVLVESGKINRLGGLARIEKVLQTWSDGRMHLISRGVQRFEVTEFIEEKSYMEARWRPVNDDDEAFNEEAGSALISIFKNYARLKAQGVAERSDEDIDEEEVQEILDSAELENEPGVSFRVLSRLELDLPDKQRYLEMTSENERVRRITKQLKEGIIALSRFYRLRAMLGGNGFLPPEGPEWEYFKDVDYL